MASIGTSMRNIFRAGSLAFGVLLLLGGSASAFAQKGGGKPPAPTGLAAVSSQIREVTLTWNTVTGATSYRIYRGLPGDRRLPLIATRTVPNFVNTGLTANTVYRYAVTAVNASGESAASYANGLAVAGLPSGANPAISFDRGGNLGGKYVADADGSNPTRIASNATSDWSPDGLKIAYFQYGSLWVCNRDGTGSVRIATPAAGEMPSLAWSPVPAPDGLHKIAYCSGGEVWVVNPDGSGNRRLTFDSSGADPYEQSVTWSPDGTRVAVEAWFDLPFMKDTIQVLDLGFDGSGLFVSNRTTVFEDLTGNWYIWTLDWCRTGDPANGRPDLIAFSVQMYDGVSSFAYLIYVLDIANPSSLRRLLPTWTARHMYPCWSPDDTQIVFSDWDNIYKVNADGSNASWFASGNTPRWRRLP